MSRYIFLGPVLAAWLLSSACTPSSHTITASSKPRSPASDKFVGIDGQWSITSLKGYTEVKNDLVKVEKSGEALDHDVLDIKVNIDAEGTGTIEGQSRCKDLLTRINPLPFQLTRPIVSEVGVMTGASLVALTVDAAKCMSLPNAQPYVRSMQKVTSAKMANGDALTAFPPNFGVFKAGWTSFTAEKECKKLTNRKYVTLLNTEGEGHSLACIGHINGDKSTLRLLILPSAQSHIIQADFARTTTAAE